MIPNSRKPQCTRYLRASKIWTDRWNGWCALHDGNQTIKSKVENKAEWYTNKTLHNVSACQGVSVHVLSTPSVHAAWNDTAIKIRCTLVVGWSHKHGHLGALLTEYCYPKRSRGLHQSLLTILLYVSKKKKVIICSCKAFACNIVVT